MRVRIDPERPAPRKLAPAIEALQRDRVVLMPTDSGYAFAAALSSRKGIGRVRVLKGYDERSRKPLSMLVNELAEIGRYAIMDTRVFRTVKRLLPGAYTVVLEASAEVPRDMRNRFGEIGVRMPDTPVCRMMVDLLGEPIVVGSMTAGEEEFALEDPDEFERFHQGTVDVVVDGGTMWPEPTTILQAVGAELEVTREGKGPVPEI